MSVLAGSLSLLLVSGCGTAGFTGLYNTPLPGGAELGEHPYTVKVHFQDVLDLVPQASVKVNDVVMAVCAGALRRPHPPGRNQRVGAGAAMPRRVRHPRRDGPFRPSRVRPGTPERRRRRRNGPAGGCPPGPVPA